MLLSRTALVVSAVAALIIMIQLPTAHAAIISTTGEIQSFILCQGTEKYIAYYQGDDSINPFGLPYNHAMNLFTDNDDNGNFVIKRFVDNKELRVSTNNIIELTEAGSGNLWSRSPKNSIFPIKLNTTHNGVSLYMTASSQGIAMKNMSQLASVPLLYQHFGLISTFVSNRK